MKKKIKELTIEEAQKICSKFGNCRECLLYKFYCLDLSYLTKKELEQEIEFE